MPISQIRKGVTPGRSKPLTADPKRTKIRTTLRRRAEMMHAMIAEIGVNPIYLNANGGKPRGAERGGSHEKAWTRAAKAWLDANQKRFAAA